MDQMSMFEEESFFPTSYEDISSLYEKYIFEGETDKDVFTSRDLKKGRSYFFYGTKIIEFVPADHGKVSLKLFTFDEKPIKLDPNMPRAEFLEWLEKLKAKKKTIFRNLIVETFACCNDFKKCSAVDSCIHQEDRFYNGCHYRTNLEAGRNFFKE